MTGNDQPSTTRRLRRVLRRAALGVLLVAGTAGCALDTGRAGETTTRPVEQPGTPPTEGRTPQVDGDDGVLPDRVSPFDDDLPALANLDPALLRAVQQAAVDARARDVEIGVTTGWRSAEYQQQLFDEAVATYGEEEARRRQRRVMRATTRDPRRPAALGSRRCTGC
jgi:hypothetical protein